MADRMRAQDFDSDGYFCPDGEARYSLLGHPIAIPAMVTYSGKTEHEEIILSAHVPIGDCPRCNERTVGDTTNTGCSYCAAAIESFGRLRNF
jgi:hypothetical protein